MYRRINNFSISLFLFLFLLTPIFGNTNSWELKKNENSIKVYTRMTEGSKFKEYKAEGIIKAPIDSVFNFLTDFDNYQNWVFNCLESATLAKVPGEQYIYYACYDMPWPVSDRDAVSVVKITHHSDNTISVSNRPTSHPKRELKPKFIRITSFSEDYELIPLDEKTVLFKMRGSYDPGGRLPAWLVNVFLTDGPYDTLVSIRKNLE